MRTTQHFHPKSISNFKTQLLSWAQLFEDVVWLDSNNYDEKYSTYDAILAVEAFTSLKTDHFDAFNKLDEYQSATKDWIFGYLTYDLKNTTEDLSSCNFDGLHFPDLYFFQPKKLFLIKGDTVEIQYLRMVDDEIDDDLKFLKRNNVSIGDSVDILSNIVYSGIIMPRY